MDARTAPTPPDPDTPKSFAARLTQKYGAGVDPEVSLDQAAHAQDNTASSGSSELLRRLSEHSLKESRYKLEGEIARGGMGAIIKVWDEDLRRTLAMKVILGKTESLAAGGTPPVDPRTLGRFLEEAQVTGQLDHPGIVPVHELGLDSDGRVYFTMKLVKGRDLKAIFDLVFNEEEGWNETRALSVMLRVCEAMAYAHKKGVIHRDLKPANVMVGSFGEVYVMDWGLARVLGRRDTHDIRLAPEFQSSLTSVKTERREEREDLSDSPLVTMDGDVMGTPTYMAPEQARGETEMLGPRSDVYSVGAMLYHLLARHAPYVSAGMRVSNRTVLAMVLHGPPPALVSQSKDVPAELVAICEKAMSREAAERYADTLALAEDLRAYLEHRVVGAYETGTWAETKKWVERNKPLAASLAAAILILVAGIFVSTARTREAEAARLETAAKNTELTLARSAAEQKTNDVLSLSAIQDLKDLEDRADILWPADPENAPKYELWLADARVLIDGQPADSARGLKKRPSLAEHEAKLVEVRQRARPLSPDQYEFEDGEDRWWHAQLSKLVLDLKAFTDDKAGGLFSSGVSEMHGWGIARRAEFARTIQERSIDGPQARNLWDQAIAAIAASPKYGGMKLAPQLGLLPIGADPESGLWEFAHLESGQPGERASDGKLALKESIGLVFVLIPGGTFRMGAQSTDPTAANYDPQARSDESPVHEVALSSYFLSKYEMTQGQWERFVGRNPSNYGLARYSKSWNRGGKGWSSLHPVEQVTWMQCIEVMSRLGLMLPTEAQWENGARAGQGTPYWSGPDLGSLKDAANLADVYGKSHGGESWPAWENGLDDGHAVHAEVGSYRANPYGLHDVVGNLWEWCLDSYDVSAYGSGPKVDPLAQSGSGFHVFRGGGFTSAAPFARSAYRDYYAPEIQDRDLGLRPARALTP